MELGEREGERSQVDCEEENKGKIMENEENRGIINKKVSEVQWARLGQFNFGALSLFSLSLSYSWRFIIFLEHSWRVWHTWILEKEEKGRVGKHKRA